MAYFHITQHVEHNNILEYMSKAPYEITKIQQLVGKIKLSKDPNNTTILFIERKIKHIYA